MSNKYQNPKSKQSPNVKIQMTKTPGVRRQQPGVSFYTNFSGKVLPLRQGNLPSYNLFRFLEKCLELRHRIFSIVGNSQGIRATAHIKMMPTWLRWAKT
jgi:hypothetical protein